MPAMPWTQTQRKSLRTLAIETHGFITHVLIYYENKEDLSMHALTALGKQWQGLEILLTWLLGQNTGNMLALVLHRWVSFNSVGYQTALKKGRYQDINPLCVGAAQRHAPHTKTGLFTTFKHPSSTYVTTQTITTIYNPPPALFSLTPRFLNPTLFALHTSLHGFTVWHSHSHPILTA